MSFGGLAVSEVLSCPVRVGIASVLVVAKLGVGRALSVEVVSEVGGYS